MASIYARRSQLWCRVKIGGVWVSRRTPYSMGDEAKARKYAAAAQQEIDRREAADHGDDRLLTLRSYAERWIAARIERGVVSAKDDDGRLKNHVLPVLGSMLVADVRPRHLIALFAKLRESGKLAPRTIYQIRGCVHTLFKSAVRDEMIDTNPVTALDRTDMPKKVDADPTWRAEAIYTRDELEQLISDGRILEDRRITYGLKGLAGLRHGEIRTLRWSQYDPAAKPLGAIYLGKTKTSVPRAVPVHPTLAAMLATWKLSGWERIYGRRPKAEDLIVPTRNMTERMPNEAQEGLMFDLALLGLRTTAGAKRKRRGHDLRRTFITLARVDGADSAKLEAVTHGPRGDIVSVYTTWPWPALCAEVAKLNVQLREGKLVEFATALATAEERARKRWGKRATLTGFEPVLLT